MPTQLNKINELPQGVPSGGDYLTYHDSNGTCNNVQLTDLQEVLPPPIDWQNFALEELRIIYYKESQIWCLAPTPQNIQNHLNDFLGIYIPRHNRIVYPELFSALPWGSNALKCDLKSLTKDVTGEIQSGLASTQIAYSATPDNQATSCAVGFAQNFERFSNGRGLGKGRWYLPHPSESVQVIMPYFFKLKYLASLMGFNWGDDSEIWSGFDSSITAANYCAIYKGTLNGCPKTTPHRFLLMAVRPESYLDLDTPTT